MNDIKSYFDEADAKEGYWDRIALPKQTQISHRLQRRLERAKRNGGNTHAIEKPHLNLRRQTRRVRA